MFSSNANMEFDSDRNNASQSKWLQMSSSPLDLNKNVWDSPGVPRNHGIFDSDNNIDNTITNKIGLSSDKIENSHVLQNSEGCVDDLTAGSVSSSPNFPQSDNQNSDEDSVIIPSPGPIDKTVDHSTVTVDNNNVWVSDNEEIDNSTQNVWGAALNDENHATAVDDTESELIEEKLEDLNNHIPDNVVVDSTLLSDKTADIETDPWNVTSHINDPVSPILGSNNDNDDPQQLPDNSESWTNNQVNCMEDDRNVSKENLLLYQLSNIFPNDLQSIMDSIYENGNLEDSKCPKVEKKINSILDYGKESRRYFNAFTRPTRQFLLLNTDDSDNFTNGLHHIVAWKNSSTEKELNTIISNWNNTENSSFNNSIRLKENAYISMFGWSTSINYTDKSTSNVASSLTEHKETMKEKLTRLAEEGANKLAKERLKKEAIKREADRKADVIHRNCNGLHSQTENFKGKKLLEAEREKNMLELQRLTNLANSEETDTNNTSKKSDNDSSTKSKPSTKKLLPRFFGFSHNNENSKKLRALRSDEGSRDSSLDFEFHLDDDDDNDAEESGVNKDLDNSRKDRFGSSSADNVNHDSKNELSGNNQIISNSQVLQLHSKNLLMPFVDTKPNINENNNDNYRIMESSKPLTPITVLQPKRKSVMRPVVSQNQSSAGVPVISTSVLQPKRNSMVDAELHLGSPISTTSSSVLQPKKAHNKKNGEVNKKQRAASLNISNGSVSTNDAFSSISIFEQSPGSSSGSLIPIFQSTQKPQPPKIERSMSAQATINVPQTRNEHIPTASLSNKSITNDNKFSILNKNSYTHDGMNVNINSNNNVSKIPAESLKPRTFSTLQILTPKKVGSGLTDLSNAQSLNRSYSSTSKTISKPELSDDDDDDDFGDFATVDNSVQPLGTASASTITNMTYSCITHSTNTSISPVPLTPKKNKTYIDQKLAVLVPSISGNEMNINNSVKDDDDDFGEFTSMSNFATNSNLGEPSNHQKQYIRQLVNTIPNMDSFL